MDTERLHPTLTHLLELLANKNNSVRDAADARLSWYYAGCPIYKEEKSTLEHADKQAEIVKTWPEWKLRDLEFFNSKDNDG